MTIFIRVIVMLALLWSAAFHVHWSVVIILTLLCVNAEVQN